MFTFYFEVWFFFFFFLKYFTLPFLFSREEATYGSLEWSSRTRAFISVWLRMRPAMPRPAYSLSSRSLVSGGALCSGASSYSYSLSASKTHGFPCLSVDLKLYNYLVNQITHLCVDSIFCPANYIYIWIYVHIINKWIARQIYTQLSIYLYISIQ